jgi:hypothetical protein
MVRKNQGPSLHITPHASPDLVPALDPDLVPPLIHGTAALAHRAYAGAGLEDLLRFIERPARTQDEHAALLLDQALAHELCFHTQPWPILQAAALAGCRLFRLADGFGTRSAHPFRLLALVAPGDLMMNTPLDFITAHLDVQLDLLYMVPERELPALLPDHDAAFFAVSESGLATRQRLQPLYRSWPRPVLNDPAAIGRLARDNIAEGLALLPGIRSPKTMRLTRDQIIGCLRGEAALPLLKPGEPVLIRPSWSHAGHSLRKIDAEADLPAYLRETGGEEFFITRFVDYRGADGFYRKLRVVLIDRKPFLCHMAVSEHWMVHYLNADMTEHQARRDEEARAMAEFETGFALRHAKAFAALADWMGLDYVQIDCAEAPDGRLLVFEADVAAIIHLMDPPELFPYKPPQMRRVFSVFEAMLRRCAAADPDRLACTVPRARGHQGCLAGK